MGNSALEMSLLRQNKTINVTTNKGVYIMKTSNHIFDCPKCQGDGTISSILKESVEFHTISIKKCTACKYQAGVKELYGTEKFEAEKGEGK